MRIFASALALSFAAAIAAAITASGQTGDLSVSPANGPVGSVVTLEGSGCNNPGQPALFMFGNQGDQGGTVGGADFTVPVDASGRFRTNYRIPSTIQGYQGNGGGTVVPGRYAFYSSPPRCIETFTVMPGSLASGGLGPAPTIGLILVVIGLAIFLSRQAAAAATDWPDRTDSA